MLIHLLVPSSSVDLQHSQQNESQRKWMAKKSTQTQTYSTKHLYWIIYSFTVCWVFCIRALLCINRTKPPKATSQRICTLSRYSPFLLHSCTDRQFVKAKTLFWATQTGSKCPRGSQMEHFQSPTGHPAGPHPQTFGVPMAGSSPMGDCSFLIVSIFVLPISIYTLHISKQN